METATIHLPSVYFLPTKSVPVIIHSVADEIEDVGAILEVST
jgi:hypothetical protein